MSVNLTVPEAMAFMQEFKHLVGEWGWNAENQHIAAWKKKNTKAQIRAHRAPDGWGWLQRQTPVFLPGAAGPISDDGKRRIILRTDKQCDRARQIYLRTKLRDRRPIWRPSMKAPKQGKLYRALTGPRGTPGQTHAAGKWHLEYGLTPNYSKWAAAHQYGGESMGMAGKKGGVPIPKRELIGWTASDVKYILEVYAKGVIRRNALAQAKAAGFKGASFIGVRGSVTFKNAGSPIDISVG